MLVVRPGQLPQLVGRSPLKDPQCLQELPASRLGRSPPVLGTPCYIYMRVVGPAATPCPPCLTCGNVRPVVTGSGGGDGGVHGGGLSGPVKGLLGLVCGARHRVLLKGGAGLSRHSPCTGVEFGLRVTPVGENPSVVTAS
ncbi:hypothetical protein (plasmid) [Streptomyces leeuwenhoekii]|uniref:Uncharacterized protein n=1 Tax=Streptomyces leeuwenhoekii TaxID=1437453 RepID=A0A0F7VMP5_STRLW|nr:hypothetical protein [Streptomyces leeuwenhoekii]